jgi:N-acetylmuramoyl-L-alanine amidase
MVRHTRAPAVLIESGFLSNPFEARLLANPEYRERLAVAIAEGVMAYQKSLPRPGGSQPLAQLSR